MRRMTRAETITFIAATALLMLWTDVSLETMLAAVPRTYGVFGSFWSAGWAASQGLNPYGAYAGMAAVPKLAGVSDINLNVPAWLPLFQLLTAAPQNVSVVFWDCAAAATFVVGCFLLLRTTDLPVAAWKIVFVLIMTPTRDTLWLAQNYALLFLCASIGWVALKRGNGVCAGLAMGVLAAMKPNFVVWPAFMLLTGGFRVAAVAGAIFACLSALPLLIDGAGVYGQWLNVMQGDRHWVFFTDVSIMAVCRRGGFESAGVPLALLLIAGSAFLVWRQRIDTLRASTIALCVSILAAPLAWGDYALVLVPALFEGLWGALAGLSAALLMVPIRVPLTSMSGPLWQEVGGNLIQLLPVCVVLVAALRRPFALTPNKQKFFGSFFQKRTASFLPTPADN